MGKRSMRPFVFPVRSAPAISICLAIATIGVYLQVSHHQFVSFDDTLYITENRHVIQGLSAENFVWAFTLSDKDNTYWHPLSWLSHMVDYEIFGPNPGPHHWINLLFHIVNAILLFNIINKMSGEIGKSALVAILFAIHPINVETVAWAAERKNLLSTFFWFLTMWVYLRYTLIRDTKSYLIVVGTFSLGLLAKPMLVTLPFALLLIDFWPLGRIPMSKFGDTVMVLGCRIKEKLPLLAVSTLSVCLSYVSLQRYGEIASSQLVSMDLRIANALVSYVRYLAKLLWPCQLSVYYPFPEAVPCWKWVPAGFLLLFFTGFVVYNARRLPAILTGWLWFTGTLLPVSGLVQGGLWPALADRWAYVPAVGIFIMIAWGVPYAVSGVTSRIRTLLLPAFATCLTILMGLSWVQIGYWATSKKLYAHALQVTDENPVAHNNLAIALKKSGKIAEAIDHYNSALQLDAHYYRAYNNLGLAMIDAGDRNEGIRYLRHAIEINPGYAEAYNNLGIMLTKQGKLDEGYQYIKRAIELDPDYLDARYNLGLLFFRSKKFRKAIEQYEMALQLRPNDPEIYNNLGVSFYKLGNINKALKYFERGLKLTPKSEILWKNLAVAKAAAQHSWKRTNSNDPAGELDDQ